MKVSVLIIRRKGMNRLVSVDVLTREIEQAGLERIQKMMGENYEVEVWRREVIEDAVLQGKVSRG